MEKQDGFLNSKYFIHVPFTQSLMTFEYYLHDSVKNKMYGRK